MKRLFFIIITFCCMNMAAQAQQPAICGDWRGTFRISELSDDLDSNGETYIIDRDYKRTVRIKLIDGVYTVRMKKEPADGRGRTTYFPEAQILSADEHRISWRFHNGDESDWSSSDRFNGKVIGRSSYNCYCTVVLTNGVVKYSEYWITTYYDRQGYKIGDQKWGESGHTLYKDEDDW